MRSGAARGDLTAKATIRNAALRLFSERGCDVVTVREIAADAGVSAALVLHHFGSKEGLRAAVDEYAQGAFEAVFGSVDGDDLSDIEKAVSRGSIAEAVARGFPAGSPLPAYLRRLVLTNDPAAAVLFNRWYAATRTVLDSMTALGVAKPSSDPAIRAAFLLVNDLAMVLLRDQLAAATGADPLSSEGCARWAREVMAVLTEGAFRIPPSEWPRR